MNQCRGTGPSPLRGHPGPIGKIICTAWKSALRFFVRVPAPAAVGMIGCWIRMACWSVLAWLRSGRRFSLIGRDGHSFLVIVESFWYFLVSVFLTLR